MRWPWDNSDEEAKELSQKSKQRSVDLEKEELWREVRQVQSINQHTLARMVTRNFVSDEIAEAIRAIQLDPERAGVKDNGTNTGKG